MPTQQADVAVANLTAAFGGFADLCHKMGLGNAERRLLSLCPPPWLVPRCCVEHQQVPISPKALCRLWERLVALLTSQHIAFRASSL